MFTAVSEAMIIYFSMYGLFGEAIFTLDNGLFAMGDMTFTACIILISIKLQAIETHNKSIMAAIAIFCSVGGWFLWNIILAGTYAKNGMYNVKDGFFDRFGRNALWWLTLILIVASALLLEMGLASLRAAFLPSDVDLFQCFEQDLSIRKRFEEASAMELQAGWHRGTKKSSLELQREAETQAKREHEVEDLLSRPRVMEEGRGKAVVDTEEQAVMVEDGPVRQSTDIQEMLSRRFGSVRQGTLSTDRP